VAILFFFDSNKTYVFSAAINELDKVVIVGDGLEVDPQPPEPTGVRVRSPDAVVIFIFYKKYAFLSIF